MNESCIGLREQRLLDKSRSLGKFTGDGDAAIATSSTGTLSSSVAEEHRLEMAAVELCDQVLQEIDEDSKFFAANPPRPVAMFHSEELRLGDVLGQGEFGTVREVREVSLSQRKLLRKDSSKLNLFDEAYTEKDEVSGLSKMDRDRLTVRQLSFREGRARYAIKRVREDLVGKDRILASLDLAVEARFLASLTHPNIVRMRGAGGQPGGPMFVIIMDRLYGTLEEKMETWRSDALQAAGAGCSGFGTRSTRDWGDTLEQIIVAYDVSRALNFLHEHKIIYRDLKPTNIGFDVRGHVKLFDLGLAKELKDRDLVDGDKYDLTPMTGTRRWMPPEVCLSRPYGLKADVYSFGLLLWCLLSLEVPFGSAITPQLHLKQVVKGGKRPRIPSFVPKSVRQLLKSCWHANADLRPKLGSVCLKLRDEISDFNGKKSSRSLMERTQHLRFYSKRSLRTAWEALGLPASSHRLGATKLGEPSTELRPITEHEPTETPEISLLSRLQPAPQPTKSSPSEEEWQVRHMFGSAMQCEMPSSWNDLSWNVSHVPENRELWQDGEGEARENSTVLLKAEIHERATDFRASIGYYYAEAADASDVDYDHRQWSHVRSDELVAPTGTKIVCGRGNLVLDQDSKRLRVELVVLRRADDQSKKELVVSLCTAVDLENSHDDSRLSPVFHKFIKSIAFNDLSSVLRDES